MSADPYPPPVYVLAAPGMPGQTLAAALGQNGHAYDLPELNLELLETVDALQRELSWVRAGQAHGLLRALAQVMGGEQTAASVEMARRWLSRRGYLSTIDTARELAGRIAPWRMICPVTAAVFDPDALKRLRRSFPEAVFVHLHLHPHAYGRLISGTVAGEVALQLSGAVDEEDPLKLSDPQELWLMAETAIATFLADVPPAQVIAQPLEALVTDTAAALQGLAQALGLPAGPADVAAMGHPERSVFRGPGPMGAHLPGPIDSFATLIAGFPDLSEVTLEGPMPWRPDAAPFRAPVRARATTLGYA
jgi:hypothetical protein